MYKYFDISRQILEVQGFSIFFRKFKRFLSSGDHNAVAKNLIKKYSKNYDVSTDIGARLGTFILDLSPYFSKCLCFEPLPINYEYITNQIQQKNL